MRRLIRSLADGSLDFITTFDCLHDMTRPDLVIKAIRSAIKHDGTWLIADVHGPPTFEQNLSENPLAPVMYGFSVICCMSSALSEPDGLGTRYTWIPRTGRTRNDGGSWLHALYDARLREPD